MNMVEGNESVILTLSANLTYVVGSPKSATVTIADDDKLPTVKVVASEANASEDLPKPGTFTISRLKISATLNTYGHAAYRISSDI